MYEVGGTPEYRLGSALVAGYGNVASGGLSGLVIVDTNCGLWLSLIPGSWPRVFNCGLIGFKHEGLNIKH